MVVLFITQRTIEVVHTCKISLRINFAALINMIASSSGAMRYALTMASPTFFLNVSTASALL